MISLVSSSSSSLVAAAAGTQQAKRLPRLRPFESYIRGSFLPESTRSTDYRMGDPAVLNQILFYLDQKTRTTVAEMETDRDLDPLTFREQRNYSTFVNLAEGPDSLLENRMNHNRSATWRELGRYHHLSNHFFSSPEIQHVDLSEFQGRNWESIFHTLFTSFPNLESLDLSRCDLTDAQLDILTKHVSKRTKDALTEMLRLAQAGGNSALLQKEVLACALSRKEPSFGQKLQELIDACQRRGNGEMLDLAKRCRGLLRISLTECQVTGDAAIALARRCPHLEHLDLGAQNISNDALIEIAQRCQHLQHLGLAGIDISNETVIAIAQGCPRLRYLDLGASNNQITDNSIIELAQRCPHLEYLDLSCTGRQITDAAIIEIARRCPHLQFLDLAEAELITDAAIIEIARRCQELRCLHLTGRMTARDPTITDATVRALAQYCPHLQKFWLPAKNITNHSITELAQGCPNLQQLSLRRGGKLTDHATSGQFAALRYLNLEGCNQITNAGILALARRCPNLRMQFFDFDTIYSREEILSAGGRVFYRNYLFPLPGGSSRCRRFVRALREHAPKTAAAAAFIATGLIGGWTLAGVAAVGSIFLKRRIWG